MTRDKRLSPLFGKVEDRIIITVNVTLGIDGAVFGDGDSECGDKALTELWAYFVEKGYLSAHGSCE